MQRREAKGLTCLAAEPATNVERARRWLRDHDGAETVEALAALLAEVEERGRREEREACARLCDDLYNDKWSSHYRSAASTCAMNIRARGDRRGKAMDDRCTYTWLGVDERMVQCQHDVGHEGLHEHDGRDEVPRPSEAKCEKMIGTGWWCVQPKGHAGPCAEHLRSAEAKCKRCDCTRDDATPGCPVHDPDRDEERDPLTGSLVPARRSAEATPCKRCGGTGETYAVRGSRVVPGEMMPCPACLHREGVARVARSNEDQTSGREPSAGASAGTAETRFGASTPAGEGQGGGESR